VICEMAWLQMSQIWCLLWLAFWRRWDAGPFNPLVFVVFVQCRTHCILCKLLCILQTFSYTLHYRHISHQSLMHGCSCRVDP
jgi:hypothetical protein